MHFIRESLVNFLLQHVVVVLYKIANYLYCNLQREHVEPIQDFIIFDMGWSFNGGKSTKGNAK